MQKKDASVMLKSEIGESTLRLKAAKFGHTIDEISPSYGTTFYLPIKEVVSTPVSARRTQRNSVFNSRPTTTAAALDSH